MILVILLLVVIMVVVLKPAFSNSSKQTAQASRNISTPPSKSQQSQYSTVVSMEVRSQFGSSKVMCRDGIVYAGNGVVIGSYKADTSTDIAIYDDQNRRIGHVHSSTTSMYVYFELHDLLMKSFSYKNPKDFNTLWRTAEVLEGSIVDVDSYRRIALYEGDPTEAGAAFVCWAHEFFDNEPYGTFFRALTM